MRYLILLALLSACGTGSNLNRPCDPNDANACGPGEQCAGDVRMIDFTCSLVTGRPCNPNGNDCAANEACTYNPLALNNAPTCEVR